MTEDEWLSSAAPEVMLQSQRDDITERQIRLFAVACCRRIWSLMADERSRKAVELAERFADGRANRRERKAAADAALAARRVVEYGPDWGLFNAAFAACLAVSYSARDAAIMNIAGDTTNAAGYAVELYGISSKAAEHAAQAALVRDILGNPFRPIRFDPAWLEWRVGGVGKLAQAIYDERRFADLPILADALEDAGCTNADILSHCRQPGEHVRGCWVIDLLLGKA
jgi:hypothetical protein